MGNKMDCHSSASHDQNSNAETKVNSQQKLEEKEPEQENGENIKHTEEHVHTHETDENKEEEGDEYRLSLLDLPWEDVLFRHILPSLPLQTQFLMRGVSHGFLDLITEYFTNAKSVNICRVAFRMTPPAFKILTKNNFSLQSLVLRNAKDWISNDLLTPVLSRSKKLQKLDLTNCLSVGNPCIQVAAVNCHNLKVLLLRECHWISKEAITVIALHCKELEQLDITGCWEVNDEAVILLAMQCKKILAEYCQTLKALQVRECRDVTEASLARLRLKNVKIDVRPPPNMRNLAKLSGIAGAQLNVQI
ncbi:hypothetical protein KUTeg_003167 [Tegillarca granosa]|uniref:F-box/LRR-repeat protein 15 n=1 Tax=Tegillarca granosa TaxID=220873 RepID=A0ABQ9FMZ1_TEGGR|nr:hypothetical protein KUTeg_003167 [Tegillarca granosa]